MIEDGKRLSGVWRFVAAQMLDDDYTSVLHRKGAQALARIWARAPTEYR